MFRGDIAAPTSLLLCKSDLCLITRRQAIAMYASNWWTAIEPSVCTKTLRQIYGQYVKCSCPSGKLCTPSNAFSIAEFRFESIQLYYSVSNFVSAKRILTLNTPLFGSLMETRNLLGSSFRSMVLCVNSKSVSYLTIHQFHCSHMMKILWSFQLLSRKKKWK